MLTVSTCPSRETPNRIRRGLHIAAFAVIPILMTSSARSENPTFYFSNGEIHSYDSGVEKKLRLPSQPDQSMLDALENNGAQFRLRDWGPDIPRRSDNHPLFAFLIERKNNNSGDHSGGHPQNEFQNELFMLRSDGSIRRIASNTNRAKLSPSGRCIAYFRHKDDSTMDLEIKDNEGGFIGRISNAGYSLSWSPDEKLILCGRKPEEAAKLTNPIPVDMCNTWVYDIESGELKRLTTGLHMERFATFHPSGKWILFNSDQNGGLVSFWKLDLNGTEPVQLTNKGKERTPNPIADQSGWDPRGRWYTYTTTAYNPSNSKLEIQTWGMEFDPKGNYIGAMQLAEGFAWAWLEGGSSLCTMVAETDVPEDALSNSNLARRLIITRMPK